MIFSFVNPAVSSSAENKFKGFSLSGKFEHFARIRRIEFDYLPFHGAYYIRLNLEKSIKDNTKLHFTLYAFNKSICAPYYEEGALRFRFNAFYSGYLKNLCSFKLTTGNLGWLTSGNGILIDQMDTDGFQVEASKIFNTNLSISYTLLPAGLMENSDTHFFSLSPFLKNVRINYMYVAFAREYDDDEFYYEKEFQKVLSVDWKIPLNKYLYVYNEIAITRNACKNFINSGWAGLFGFDFLYIDESKKIEVRTEVREYSKNFNSLYQGHLEKIYHGMDSQDKKINNWRNYALSEGRLFGYAFDIKFDREFFNSIKLKNSLKMFYSLHLEYLKLLNKNSNKEFIFYTIGGKLNFNKNVNILLAFSNKSVPYLSTPYLEDEYMFIPFDHYLLRVGIDF